MVHAILGIRPPVKTGGAGPEFPGSYGPERQIIRRWSGL